MQLNLFDHFDDPLTEDQKLAINKIEDFLSSDLNCFLLKGYAGTGKTFLLKGLIKYFNSTGRSFRLMAPTGRAAMVIGEKTATEAYTIHKGIYNLDVLEDDDHTFKFKYGLNQNQDSLNSIYVIDESSMISDFYNEDEFFVFGSGYLLKDLFKYIDIENKNSKIIFIGDNAQLPPIGMSFSPALSKEYLLQKYHIKIDEIEMRQVQRQSEGSGILKIATSLRKCLEREEFNRFEISTSNQTINYKRDEFLDAYLKIINKPISNDTIVITHSNRQAHDYNISIRQNFFPNQVDVQVNDILINTKNNYNYVVDLYNGQFLKVIAVSPFPEPQKTIRFYKRGGEKVEVKFNFRDVIIELKDIKGITHQLKCKIIDDFLKSDLPRLTQNEQQALYVDFKNRNPNLKPSTQGFKEAIRTDSYFNALQLKYGYAITCHKSQGGEWKNVFVNFQVQMNVLSRGFFRWAYTGVTRAKEKLVGINAQSYSPLTEYFINSISTIKNIPGNQFYIPNNFFEQETLIEFSHPFLKAKYIEIKEKLKGQEIEISLLHNEWVERYTFKRNEKQATIDLSYNKTGFTGNNKVVRNTDAEFAKFVSEMIATPIIFDFEYNPPKEYQRELYSLLKEKTSEENIPITNILNESYSDRYFLKTDANCAYLDCTYTSQGIYSYIKPYSTSGGKDAKLDSLLKRLINA